MFLFAIARDFPEELIPLATCPLRRNALLRLSNSQDTRLLAVQVRRSRTLLVFDIAKTVYHAMLGHLSEHSQLPVVVTHFSKLKGTYTAIQP